jgi:hypothetical protein
MGLLTKVDKRAFHHKLRGHKEKPVIESRMTLQEMSAYRKILSDARRQLGNLMCIVVGPAEDQIEEMIHDAASLKDDLLKFEERLKELYKLQNGPF